MNRQRINLIDTWRFIAVSLVTIFHIAHYGKLAEYVDKVPGVSWRLVELGKLGVLIFFCISGFVICRGLLQEIESNSSVSLAAFYLRRTLRIMPPLWIYTGTLAVLSALGLIQIPEMSLFRSLAFVCNFSWLGQCGWYSGHTWSLAYEEQFYLVFPMLFVVLSFYARPGSVLMLTGALVVIAISAHFNNILSIAEYITVFIYLLTGCATALYWKDLEPLLRKLPASLWAASVAICFVLGGVIALPAMADKIMRLLILPPLICFTILSTPVSHPHVKKFFENGLLLHLGKISYGIYLWQQLATTKYPSMGVIAHLLLIPLIVIVAHLSYTYIERPLINLASRWSDAIRNQSPDRRAGELRIM